MNLTPEQMETVMKVRRVDAKATAFMRDVLDEHGFPTREMVGEDGARASWLLIQHADAAPDLQARALEMMAPLVEAGQVAPSEYALLIDRVRVARASFSRSSGPSSSRTRRASSVRSQSRTRRPSTNGAPESVSRRCPIMSRPRTRVRPTGQRRAA